MRARRLSFATVAVTGLGTFVAIATGVTLYFSAVTGVRSTQELIAGQAEAHLDALEQYLAARLEPVEAQAASIAQAVNEGGVDPARMKELDAFMQGALASAPQVSGIGIVEASGKARNWMRDARASSEDWSQRADVSDWLAQGAIQPGPSWRPPFWTPVMHMPAVMHDVPLRRNGKFLGMLGQVVPIDKLSEELAQFRAEHGVTPFILYGEDTVLAYPALAKRGVPPLAKLADLGDPVLVAMRSPQRWEPLGLRRLKRAQGGHLRLGSEQYLFVYREMKHYGPQPWTIGLYLDPVAGGQRDQMLSALSSVAAGFGVLVLAVLVAAFTGRRLARSVEALAGAARAVAEERLETLPPMPASAIAEFHAAGRAFEQMIVALRERRVMRDTLGQFVPEQVARSVVAAGGKLEPIEAKATVLMCDLEGFAALTDSLGPRRTFEFLNAYFECIVAIVERHGGVITQFQGDAILAVFNLPLPDRDHAAQALRAAIEIVRESDRCSFAGVKAKNRIGLATGRVVAGAVGSKGRLSYTVHGNAVNLAARIELANKDHGTRILLTEKTAERCPGFALRKVVDAEIRGYAARIALFTPAA
jgi:adenylate cyclase